MKAYLIGPTFDLCGSDDARREACVSLVAEMVCERLRADGDDSHQAIDWRDPGAAPWGILTAALAEPHLVPLGDPDKLMGVVRMSVDPNSPASAGVIRSIATCRAVTFGYDGQAFLCLRHEDGPPISRDPALVTVSEQPDLLAGTDYFDGWIKPRGG